MNSHVESKVVVSVITPLYNAERFIAETIESVLNQSYTSWEMIIVDDCSTDRSKEIVNKYTKKDERIKLIESRINSGGPAKPRNIGIENALGRYIAFLDADDLWLHDKLKLQVEFMQQHTDVDILHSKSHTIGENGKVTGVFKNQKTYKKMKYFMDETKALFVSNYVNINTVIMKNDCSLRFRDDDYLTAIEDWSFWIDNMLIKRRFHFMNEALINYRVDQNSISARGTDKVYRKIFYMYSVYLNEMKISPAFFIFLSIKNSVNLFLKTLVK